MTLTMEVTEVGLAESRMTAAEAVTETGTRQMEFYAAAFGNKDSHGDILDAKAFDAWLPKFYDAGQSLKLSFNHAAVLDDLDPTNTIGYASADPQHVWADDFGLRVSGVINTATEKGRAVEWQVNHGLLKGASLAYTFKPENIDVKSDHTLVKSVDRVLEAGLVPNPANQSAVLLWMKSEGLTENTHPVAPYMTVEEFKEIFKSAPTDVQAWHDSLVSQGAVCSHEEMSEALANAEEALETPNLLTTDDEQRLRNLRYMEITET